MSFDFPPWHVKVEEKVFVSIEGGNLRAFRLSSEWSAFSIKTEILTSTSLLAHCFSMKSTAFLTIIMTINWIFEIISFYAETSSTIFDIINALQGVLIFLMFVCLPRPMKLIKHWWNDRGSFQVLRDSDSLAKPTNDIQMMSLCKQWWVCRKEATRMTDLNKAEPSDDSLETFDGLKKVRTIFASLLASDGSDPRNMREKSERSSLLVQLRWFVSFRM